MFRVSVAEIGVFLVLLILAFTTMPTFLEWPMLLVTLALTAVLSFYGWFYFRKMFTKVILVRGMGVNVICKDFQTAPMHPNPDVWKVISSVRNTHVTALFWTFTQDFEEGVVSHYGLSKFYDKVFYPSDFNTSDPQEYLANICKALGVSPRRVVLVDVDEKGMAAGKSLGMDVIYYSDVHKLASQLKERGI
ncbi:MAG: hypothetical protein V1722_01070 [Candidatus Micrarchaeota archaeon]